MTKTLSRRNFLFGGAAVVLGAGAVGLTGSRLVADADNYKMGDAKWIWLKNPLAESDAYGEFYASFNADTSKSLVLELACDGIYAFYINDVLAGFAQCSDWPHYKYYDRLDITKFCINGSNNIKIQVWHMPGYNSSIYRTDVPGVIFQIIENKKPITWSNPQTQSRGMDEYWNNRNRHITGQMGFDFWHGLDYNDKKKEYTDSIFVVDKTYKLHEREILPLELQDLKEAKLIQDQTDFKPDIETGFHTLGSMLFDLGEETVGFLDFKFTNSLSQQIHFAYGEHIVDKDEHGKHHVRYAVGGRDFTVHVQSYGDKQASGKTYENQYMNPFRRLGARYIEVFYEKEKPNFEYIGIRPVMYPLQLKEYPIKDTLLASIYKQSIKTLRCSMHEHYEDCPWREQALYGMDSRNQMLCGYYVFESHEYQRHNLILLSQSLRNLTQREKPQQDGILEICSPCDIDRPIPFFSLCFIQALCEYIQHTKDKSILKVCKYSADTILKACVENIDAQKGLISVFPGKWNFYEWTPGSDGEDHTDCHLILNCAFVYVHELYKSITNQTFADVNKIRENIKREFYMSDKGVFRLHKNDSTGSQLGNAMAVLAGIGDKDLVKKISDDVKQKWEKEEGGLIKASLSMKAYVYDALIDSGEEYKNVVLKDIKYVFPKMMNDPTFTGTFWETEVGQSDFSNAGSLCHGWSAIPSYYIPKYFL